MKRYAILAAALVVLLAHAFWFDHTCDDAFISFRYASNFAHGRGLVFNVGERVMGYSDLLWVLLLALFEKIGVTSPIAARVLGVAFSFGTIVVIERHLVRSERNPLLAIAMLVLNATFAMWTFGGLEGPAFGFFLTLAVVLAMEQRAFVWIGVAMGLACITRPEGFLYLVPLFAFLMKKVTRADLVRVFVPALVFMGAQALFIHFYYGGLLPNTYFAKEEPLAWPVIARGLELVSKYLMAYFAFPAIVWALGIREIVRFQNERCLLPLYVIATFVFFFLRVGGDVLVYFRLWHVTIPMTALVATEIVHRLPQPLAALLGSSFALFGLSPSRGVELDYLRKDDANLRALRAIAPRLPKDAVLAANVVGVLTYASDLRMVDMLGLTDAHIARAPKSLGLPAHECHDGKYVLDQKPDLIFFGYPVVKPASATLEPKKMYPSDDDLLFDPRFKADYELVRISFPEGDLIAYQRKR